MALYNKMQKLVDATVEEFCRRVAEKYDTMDVEEMMALWKETAKAPKRKSDKPKKKTAYMNFSQTVRVEMKTANAEVTFGEISKEVSRRWKEMSPEEKLSWTPSVEVDAVAAESTTGSPSKTSPDEETVSEKTPKKTKSKAVSPGKKMTTTKKSKAVSPTKAGTPKKPWSPPAVSPSPIKAMTPVKKTKASSPSKMKLAELKKLCKDKGLSIKGLKTREELEELLESIDESDKEDNGSESEDDYSGTLVDAVDDDAILA